MSIPAYEFDHWEFRSDKDGSNRQKRVVYRDGVRSGWEDIVDDEEVLDETGR